VCPLGMGPCRLTVQIQIQIPLTLDHFQDSLPVVGRKVTFYRASQQVRERISTIFCKGGSWAHGPRTLAFGGDLDQDRGFLNPDQDLDSEFFFIVPHG